MTVIMPKADYLDACNAIREKGGASGAIKSGRLGPSIRAISGSGGNAYVGYPDYVVAEGQRVANGMASKMGANSITAVIMSDMHEFGDNDHSDATIIDRYRRANRNAGQGAKVVADNIDLDFFANLGDFAWGAKTSTVKDFVQSITNARGYIYEASKDVETFFTPGNHDTATYGFAQNNEYLSQNVCNGLIGTYRYVDFTAKKVRVICLNTAEVEGLSVSGQSGTERITGTQLQWFANALDLSAKSDASKWGIIILSHHPLDWGSILPAANCLQAYLSGGNYSVTHNGVAVSKNFSGKNAAKVICQFHGHVHGFRVDNIRCGSVGSLSTTTVKRIAIPNACFARTNEYGENTGVDSNGLEFGETTSYDKTDNCAENTAFCLVSIDLNNKVIYADCYGAGYDRVVSYGEAEVTTYTVTNNLTNATTSNSAGSVVSGGAYSATITAKSGYELKSVTVTMGGTNVTSSVYSNGKISISNVTGNIVITVTTAVSSAPVMYAVTNNMTNASTNNSTSSVEKGSSYTATISPSSGYNLESGKVTVTMGGTDITVSAYKNGVITISNVTGAIVITVKAVNYHNLVLTSIDSTGAIYNGKGYKTGYRLNSSGVETALANAISCGFIPYNKEVVRVFGSNVTTASTTGHYIALYDASFTKLQVLAGGTTDGMSYEKLNGKYLMTLVPDGLNATNKAYVENAKYIRCSFGECLEPEDFVVTLNEVIS